MNNKLITTVLENAGYKNSEVLAQIVNAVPNPTVALEMLLNAHTPVSVEGYYKKGDSLIKITSVDSLRDRIHYTCYDRKTKQIWYLTEEKKRNGVYEECRPSNYYDYSWVPAPGVTERSAEMSVEDLNRWKEISEEDFYTTIGNWNAVVEVTL